MNTYAYIRVSTREQNEDRQVLAMEEFGVDRSCTVIEKQSGKDFDRPLYRRLLKKLKPGDTLVIKSIDRLGRNYDEILEQWRILTKEKKVDIVVLDMPLLDTRNGRDLTGTLIADIVLQLLSYVAQTEREFIRQRQREGIAAAKARGVHCGRYAMVRPDNYKAVFLQWQNGKLSGRKAAAQVGVSHTTFLRWAKDDRPAEIPQGGQVVNR
ncbi:MAG: recombinase family protein [Clostridia bacterium]|nr:recombinase family protein [Clostridia bacterium]